MARRLLRRCDDAGWIQYLDFRELGEITIVERQDCGDAVRDHRGDQTRVMRPSSLNLILRDQALPFLNNGITFGQYLKNTLDALKFAMRAGHR